MAVWREKKTKLKSVNAEMRKRETHNMNEYSTYTWWLIVAWSIVCRDNSLCHKFVDSAGDIAASHYHINSSLTETQNSPTELYNVHYSKIDPKPNYEALVGRLSKLAAG